MFLTILKKAWWIILLVVVLYFGLAQFSFFPSWLSPYRERIVVTETPVKVEQIKAIGKLVTAEYYGDVYADIYELYDSVMVKYKDNFKDKRDSLTVIYSHIHSYPFNKDQDTKKKSVPIIYLARGNVKAGIDVAKIGHEKVDDYLLVSVDAPSPFITVINPWFIEGEVAGYELIRGEKETGFTDAEIRELKILCKTKLTKLAIENGLIDKAKTSTEETLKGFFGFMGYKKVKVDFNKKKST